MKYWLIPLSSIALSWAVLKIYRLLRCERNYYLAKAEFWKAAALWKTAMRSGNMSAMELYYDQCGAALNKMREARWEMDR